MYRETLIIIIVIIIVIILEVFTHNYTKGTVDLLTEKLNSLEFSINNEDGKLETKEEEVNKIWDEKYKKLAFYLEHDELEKVKTELTKLRSNIKSEEFPNALENIETIKYILIHIQDKEEFSLQSIF